MATHYLQPVIDSLHGKFHREMVPILEVESGDILVASVPDAGWGQIAQPDPFGQPLKLDSVPEDRRNGHCLLGPVSIKGAAPGDAIEVCLEAIRPGRWGWTAAGGWPSEYNVRLGLADAEHFRMGWRIDGDHATDAKGRRVSLSPFLGWIGLMPAEPGHHSTTPPRRTGGNIDCREIVSGSQLFLPVEVEGGLLSFGDGHAVQGDGEVSGPALECPIEELRFRIQLHPGGAPALPYANTPAGWVHLGFGASLDDAMYAALGALVDRMAASLQASRAEALTLASLKASLRVTQIVNDIKGVHALLPTHALRELGLAE